MDDFGKSVLYVIAGLFVFGLSAIIGEVYRSQTMLTECRQTFKDRPALEIMAICSKTTSTH
jgi:hypothetical protein